MPVRCFPAAARPRGGGKAVWPFACRRFAQNLLTSPRSLAIIQRHPAKAPPFCCPPPAGEGHTVPLRPGRGSAGIAQLVEQLIRNQQVACSSHVSSSTPGQSYGFVPAFLSARKTIRSRRPSAKPPVQEPSGKASGKDSLSGIRPSRRRMPVYATGGFSPAPSLLCPPSRRGLRQHAKEKVWFCAGRQKAGLADGSQPPFRCLRPQRK